MFRPQEEIQRLLDQVAYDQITRWTSSSLGLDGAAFSALVQRLIELDEAAEVEIVSMSHELLSGSRQASAVRFVRLRPA